MKTAMTQREINSISDTAAEWVARRAAGLGSAGESELRRWLAADPRHQSAFDHHAAAFAVFDRPAASGQGPAFAREVATRVRRRRRVRLGAASAGIAVVLAAAAFWPTRWKFEKSSASSNAIVRAPESRTLPDGSVVALKPGSQISVNFSGEYREIALLRGGAHFQVAKDPARPFVVFAAGIETRAIGTAFSVQLDRQEVEVLVTEGRVAVERADAAAGAAGNRPALAFVNAGNRFVVNLAAGAVIPSVSPVPPSELAEDLAWRSPRVEFTDTPLAEAVALMNRQAASPGQLPTVRLVLDPGSTGLAREPVSGLFRADNTEAFVRMLEVTLDLQAQRRDGEIVLSRK
jgi:transmembrane sensor